jgi:hypothetical protein
MKATVETFTTSLRVDLATNKSSPGMASSICLGRQTNGWTTWEDEKGKTLDDVYR